MTNNMTWQKYVLRQRVCFERKSDVQRHSDSKRIYFEISFGIICFKNSTIFFRKLLQRWPSEIIPDSSNAIIEAVSAQQMKKNRSDCCHFSNYGLPTFQLEWTRLNVELFEDRQIIWQCAPNLKNSCKNTGDISKRNPKVISCETSLEIPDELLQGTPKEILDF